MKYYILLLFIISIKDGYSQIFTDSPTSLIPELVSQINDLQLLQNLDTVLVTKQDSSCRITIKVIRNTCLIYAENSNNRFYTLKMSKGGLQLRTMGSEYKCDLDFGVMRINSVSFQDNSLFYKVIFDNDTLVKSIVLRNNGNKNIAFLRFSHQIIYQSLESIVPMNFLKNVCFGGQTNSN